MPIEATVFPTRSPEGQQLKTRIQELLKTRGIQTECNDRPTQSEFFRACIARDLVIVDATVEEDNDQHNYAAFTAQPLAYDHVLVVSRSYLPQNFYGLREGGAPVCPFSFTNDEIIQWLEAELNELVAIMPRPGWKKNLFGTGVLEAFRGPGKAQARERQRLQVFISFRNSAYEAVGGDPEQSVKALKRRLESGFYHDGIGQGVRLFSPDQLAFRGEVMSRLERWSVFGFIEEKLRTLREFWIMETDDYYDSWWTCGELLLLAYFQAVSGRRPLLKVYNPRSGEVRTEPPKLVPTLSYAQRRDLDRLLSGSGRSRGAETARNTREMAELPVLGALPVFNHRIFSQRWLEPVFEDNDTEKWSWKNGIDVENFLQMQAPKLTAVSEDLLRAVRTKGRAQANGYAFFLDKPRYVWYATRMGRLNGPEHSEELTISRQPVIRAQKI